MRDRIIKFLQAENKTSSQLAEDIGVQPSGISHIISGRNKPSLDFILKMLERYKHLSTEWLLFGKGNMYKDDAMQELFDTSAYEETPEKNDSAEKMNASKESDKSEEENTSHSLRKNAVLEKIILFYSDNSFSEFIPQKNNA
ncbi:MAG: helix-turn-helix transcriptional regulator [Bacteroidetes bacterium]|jgi:transcriptional regulator with XRE-family HTH domain|nr:helix-turn-helix transcriptional regulator [Bacteroidota bacterium]